MPPAAALGYDALSNEDLMPRYLLLETIDLTDLTVKSFAV